MITVYVHCSASSFGNAALIAIWHYLRGFSGIGYHRVLLNGWLAKDIYDKRFDGHVETGRPLDEDPIVTGKEVGAHVLGHNTDSVGVVLIGESGKFTPKQMRSLYREIYELEQQFGEIAIEQHSDADKKKPYCAGLITQDIRDAYYAYKYSRDNKSNVNLI
jgi:N-acetylmuramoyl-L-alanine amidase